jgi:hypothetical protein
MTFAVCTSSTEGVQDSATAAMKRPFLDPAVDTPLSEGFGSSVEVLYFSVICRTFRSGGTRIRTGDTMLFRHIHKPLGMRKTRVGKRIYVRRVPVGITWFCPYCCATVDTSSVASIAVSRVERILQLVLQCHFSLAGSAASILCTLQHSLIIFATH